MKLNVYDNKGVKKGTFEMPKSFVQKENLSLLAQAVRVYEDRKHSGTSKVKTRHQVSISRRKIYRQKGTGGARHGAKSAPIFVGGGIAHGPKGVKRVLNLPQKMRQKALGIALTLKAKEGKLFTIESLAGLKKTKDAKNLVDKIAKSETGINKSDRFLFAVNGSVEKVKALRNLKNVFALPFSNLNAYNVHFSSVVLLDKEALNKSTAGAGKKELKKDIDVKDEHKERKPAKKAKADSAKKKSVKSVRKSV
jgi:large subunit ribosomal protein L4